MLWGWMDGMSGGWTWVATLSLGQLRPKPRALFLNAIMLFCGLAILTEQCFSTGQWPVRISALYKAVPAPLPDRLSELRLDNSARHLCHDYLNSAPWADSVFIPSYKWGSSIPACVDNISYIPCLRVAPSWSRPRPPVCPPSEAVEGDFSGATLKQGMWRFYQPIFLQQMFLYKEDPPFCMFKPAQ